MVSLIGIRHSFVFQNKLGYQEFDQHSVEFFGFFDLRLVGRILEPVNKGTGDKFLKLYIPVFLIERVVFAGRDEERDAKLGKFFYEFIRGRAGLVDRAS